MVIYWYVFNQFYIFEWGNQWVFYSILDHINDYSETNILLIRNSKIISSDAILLSVFFKKVVSSSYG